MSELSEGSESSGLSEGVVGRVGGKLTKEKKTCGGETKRWEKRKFNVG